MIDRLTDRGLDAAKIHNPHLPKGVPYDMAARRAESRLIQQPDTLVVIHVCPSPKYPLDKQLLGANTMKEIGRYGWSRPERTGIVLDVEGFSEARRLQLDLQMLAEELAETFGDDGPLKRDFAHLDDWVMEQFALL